VILEVNSLNTVLLIENIAMRVFKSLPCFPNTDPTQLRKQLERMHDK